MSDNIILNKFTVAGGDTSRFVDRGPAKTQVIMEDKTPAGAKETLFGYPVTLRTNINVSVTNGALTSIITGSKIAVTQISLFLDSNLSVPITVTIGFGTTTTPTASGVIFSHPNLASTGVVASRGDGSGIIGLGTDAQNILITATVPTGGSYDVLITYYVVPS